MVTEAHIRNLLRVVKDPEIPTVSLVDMGVVHRIDLPANGGVHVELIPTFSGCPAMSVMALEVEQVLRKAGFAPVTVAMNKQVAWHSNMISEEGRKGLLEHGLSPPPHYDPNTQDYALEAATCPHCGSTRTVLKNPFGPTLCRAIHQCLDCQETFEQFKPV
ncbi:MAG: phenylacetate-CoA oxygenase subunit PaaJ [Bacteroidetes bacterium]|nr:phenylacetate-CoA oxygenase subunit PaaJ [Bacteroidota bacterium]